MPPPGLYHAGNRAYPDVSISGVNYQIVMPNGAGTPIFKSPSGTSASAPVWAGILARANSLRIRNGLNSTGLISQTLYEIARTDASASIPAFNDITIGSNNCGEFNNTSLEPTCLVSCYGYPAAPGFDLVTGLGTPNVGMLLDLLSDMGALKARLKLW